MLLFSPYILRFFIETPTMTITQPTGWFDATRETCSVPHCSWLRMQSWVGCSMWGMLDGLMTLFFLPFQMRHSKISWTARVWRRSKNALASSTSTFQDMQITLAHWLRSEFCRWLITSVIWIKMWLRNEGKVTKESYDNLSLEFRKFYRQNSEIRQLRFRIQ